MDHMADTILSIGAIEFSNPDNRFYKEGRVAKNDPVSDEALRFNGFTKEQIYDSAKPSEQELVSSFFAWLGQFADQTIAGQNVDFDRRFLDAKAKKYGLATQIGKRVVDMHTLAYTRYMQLGLPIPLANDSSNINTDTIFQFVGLKARPGTHSALEDAKLEAETFSRLLFGRNLLVEYKTFAVPKIFVSQDS